MISFIFYQINLTGSWLFNRTSAEIGYLLDKKCKKSIFIILKTQKYRNCPALHFHIDNENYN